MLREYNIKQTHECCVCGHLISVKAKYCEKCNPNESYCRKPSVVRVVKSYKDYLTVDKLLNNLSLKQWIKQRARKI